MSRREELATNLARVRERIEGAARAAGRDPGAVTLTVVTKHFPASDVRLLADLGVQDVGENRHQEAQPKALETQDLGLRWHFVGRLQSNKASAVGRYAHVVESVDRGKLVPGLSRAATETGRAIDCLVQVSLDEPHDASRGGASPGEVVALAEAVAAADGLRLRGLMGVAPLGRDPRPSFDLLAGLSARVRHVDEAATWLSAGMSGDLEEAVAAGATHVRVGSAILGARPRIQ